MRKLEELETLGVIIFVNIVSGLPMTRLGLQGRSHLRMWKVVKKISELKVPVGSAKVMGEDRTVWAAFVKTKTARTRSAHISMVRRIVMGLAADAKNDRTQIGWNAGTIWCGVHKLAPSTHRCPKEAETVYMAGGWINLHAVGLAASCSSEVAKSAFEREL